MSENKYTPEPWRAFNNGQGVVGVSTDRSDVCWTRIEKGGWLDSDRTIDADYENARRIVACINACAGIDTELLEIIEDNDKTLAGVIANVEKQRDELLKAIALAMPVMDAHAGPSRLADFREAITSVKGEL